MKRVFFSLAKIHNFAYTTIKSDNFSPTPEYMLPIFACIPFESRSCTHTSRKLGITCIFMDAVHLRALHVFLFHFCSLLPFLSLSILNSSCSTISFLSETNQSANVCRKVKCFCFLLHSVAYSS